MRKVSKSRKKLVLNLASLVGGAIIFATAIILINIFSEPDIPMAEAYPEMYFPVMILTYAGIIPFTYGLIGTIITAMTVRGKRVFIDGQMLNDVKVYNSKYQSNTVDGLKKEIQNKLAAQEFLPLGNTGAYFRATIGALPDKAFYFACLDEFSDSEDILLARADAIWKHVSSIKSGTRLKDTAIVFFLPIDELTNEQILKTLELKERLLGESKALCDICLYSIAEKRAYITFTTMNVAGQPFSIERGSVAFVNLCTGSNKIDFSQVFAKKAKEVTTEQVNTTTLVKEKLDKTTTAAEEPATAAKLDFKMRGTVYPKIRNIALIFYVVCGGILLSGFILVLILWLTVFDMATIKFFCLFTPLLLIPGLTSVYFAVASYKKLELSRDGARLIRPFGNIKIFEGELCYAEKILTPISMYISRGRKVLVIYPSFDLMEGDTVFSVNNYKKYIIIKYCDHNKKILEELAVKKH